MRSHKVGCTVLAPVRYTVQDPDQIVRLRTARLGVVVVREDRVTQEVFRCPKHHSAFGAARCKGEL